MLKWYVVPLLMVVAYIFAREIKESRATRNWDPILAALVLLGADFFNETWNGWVFHFTNHSAFWTTPGETALRTMIGWNIEIMFMFAISGIIFYHTLAENRKERILGLTDRWFWAIGYSVFCVIVECLLNLGGHLVWEYPFWNLSFGGVWLIFFFGYFHFYVAAIAVLGLKTDHGKIRAIAAIYSVPIIMNVIGKGIFNWAY